MSLYYMHCCCCYAQSWHRQRRRRWLVSQPAPTEQCLNVAMTTRRHAPVVSTQPPHPHHHHHQQQQQPVLLIMTTTMMMLSAVHSAGKLSVCHSAQHAQLPTRSPGDLLQITLITMPRTEAYFYCNRIYFAAGIVEESAKCNTNYTGWAKNCALFNEP